jgi:hypothetical protein
MKRFSARFFIALLTFFGISVFTGWFLLRGTAYSNLARPAFSDSKAEPEQLQWNELKPVFLKHNLIAARPDNNHEVPGIEEADARSFAPLAGETIFLQALSPTDDSKELKPRYWLRVEDYASPELAQKRADEYITEESYERMARAYGNVADRHMMAKLSLRIWAIARGRRVYALTTNVYLFELIKLPEKLKESVSKLPEN